MLINLTYDKHILFEENGRYLWKIMRANPF